MFGSQALETAIGLTLMFFVLATAASSFVEFGAKIVNARSKGLKRALRRMLEHGLQGEAVRDEAGNPELDDDGKSKFKKVIVKKVDVEKLLLAAVGRTNRAYVSAKSFADAATQMVAKIDVLEDPAFDGLRQKMDELAREARGDLVALKTGLEKWFDEAMASAQEKYRKITSYLLLGIGLGLAVALNASTTDVAQDLWKSSVTRQVVVESAGKVVETPSTGTPCTGDPDIDKIVCSVEAVNNFKLPLGWTQADKEHWSNPSIDWWWGRHLIGWLLTGLLVMLGAPFWFDLLGRLVSLTGKGQRPKPAPEDNGSNTTQFLALSEGRSGLAMLKLNEETPPVPDWLAKALNLEDNEAWTAAAATRRATSGSIDTRIQVVTQARASLANRLAQLEETRRQGQEPPPDA